MSLAVVCFCGYFCNNSVQWRSGDFDSYKWVQALKGRELNKYALVPVNGVKRRLSNENLADAAAWFGIFVANYLKEQGIAGPFLVIPVPNSDSVSASSRPRTRKLAKAICDTLKDGSIVLDCLRCKKDLGSASKEGGPRDAATLFGNLVVLKDQLDNVDAHDFNVLLVDDVTTSGGHLRACGARLKSKGLSVDIILCGGKTVYDQDNPAFHTYEYELDEHQP